MHDQADRPFDRNLLHPGAAGAIDKDGAALLEAAEIGTTRQEEASFDSRHPIKFELGDDDMLSEPIMARSDLSGRVVMRYFMRNGYEVSLRESGYKSLRRLVERILNAKPFSQGVSDEFLEVEVFTWWRDTLRGATSASLSSHLLDRCDEAVKHHTILVPLSNIEIETAFRLGETLVRPIGPAMFDRYKARGIALNPDAAEEIEKAGTRWRDQYGHLAAVEVEVTGEPLYAHEAARRVAFDMADLLRFMSPAAATWNVTFGCLPFGCDHEPKTTVIGLADGEISGFKRGVLNAGWFHWQLSSAELDQLMRQLHFENCDAFFRNKPLTSLQERVKKAISAYSQGIASYDLRNRLMYAMSAAEHLLLRDGNEPIQTNVGDRMAFLVAREPAARRAVVANFKRAYALRSGQVHHLAKIDDQETLTTFFQNMWTMLIQAMNNMGRIAEHAALLDALDDLKYS